MLKKMMFFEKIEALKDQYKDDCIVRKNGTILLASGKIPKCKHMLFEPLPKSIIKEHLIDQYKLPFPEDYANFLEHMNGVGLFWVRVLLSDMEIATSLFTVYGLPLTPPFSRPLDMEEPFDVRIEGLARHKDLPAQWFKVASYYRDFNFSTIYDLFIDTDTGRIYSCEKNKSVVIEEWDNLNECFCDIYNRVADAKEEYVYKKN